jgi:glycosyltransferase involved in cell wall biosynthesis
MVKGYKRKVKKLCFVIEDVLGGVTVSVLNLIHHIDISQLHCTVLLVQHKEWGNDTITSLLEGKGIPYQHCTISKLNNIYLELKKIRGILCNFDAIVASNIDEMEALNRFRLPLPLIYAMHADNAYEYNTALTYQHVIDGYHAVSNYIAQTISKELKENRFVRYIPHAMPATDRALKKEFNSTLHVIFVGRFIATKGSEELHVLRELLNRRGIKVKWTFATNGKNEEAFKQKWGDQPDSFFYTNISNKEVYEQYKTAHLMVLPTRVEGFPLALIEAMNHGVVPLVTPLKSGVPELVTHNKNGYLIPFNEVESYAEAIQELDNNRLLLENLSTACMDKMREEFNPLEKASEFTNFVLEVIDERKTNVEQGKRFFNNHQFYSRLDKWYIPNFLVWIFRTLKRRLF